jgi:CHASE3 domain sensor protein
VNTATPAAAATAPAAASAQGTGPAVTPNIAPARFVSLIRRGASTPLRLRALLILLVVGLAVWGIGSSIAVAQREASTHRAVDASAQVLIATQQLQSAIAEADAAATSNFLSPDREQARLFRDALDQAAGALETAARNAGDDEQIHTKLSAIGAALIRYSSQVERANTTRATATTADPALLQPATALLDEIIRPRTTELLDASTSKYKDDTGKLGAVDTLGFITAVIALLVLLEAQLYIAKKHRRIINVPLFLATLCLLAGTTWFAAATFGQHRQLAATRSRAYNSLVGLNVVRASAYEIKTAESFYALNPTKEAADLVGAADTSVVATNIGQVVASADTSTEMSAGRELETRWDRYLADRQRSLAASPTGKPSPATLASGPSNASFGAFNAVLDGVLADNQSQFNLGLADAKARLRNLRLILATASALAVVLAAWGVQLRLREYR